MDQSFPSHDLVFTVTRSQPELVAPAKPTPRKFKLLSDIDDQDGLRFQVPIIHFYRFEPSMAGKDPAHIIKNALAHTLVFYYPFAGRLREGPARKLMVDCTGEGVLFVEADADVTLAQFGHRLQPPIPCFQDLLYNVPGSEGVINCPLLHIQVTRLKCGGFIFAYHLNHTMCDGPGIIQFLKALTEIARGASEPSIRPVWRRDQLLNARDPPRVTCTHYEYEEVPVPSDDDTKETENMVTRSFFFGPTEIASIRQLLPHHLRQCTRFELLTALVWRCRTIALQLQRNDDVRLMCIINARGRTKGPLEIPEGYYGNAFVYPAAVTTAGKLGGNSIGYALELVRKAKDEMSEEYVQSVADLMVIRGRPCFTMARSWIVSNLVRAGFRDVDFGWGKAVFAGIAKAGAVGFHGVSFIVSCENAKGEEGVSIPICLPSKAMERFVREMDDMLKKHENAQSPRIIMSLL